ncbi:DNA-binding protein [Streptomyces sp. NPDC046977]|uniref:DNA-binding protein n=1 Tax=Streptomyces sp. NPDC046977 TaxID=3154703 RepID=UPI0033EEB3A0
MTARHTYAEAAAILRVDERWLRRNIARLPRTKKGRVVTFSDDDLARIDAMFHREPEAEAGAITTTAGPHPLAALKPLPARRAG